MFFSPYIREIYTLSFRMFWYFTRHICTGRYCCSAY